MVMMSKRKAVKPISQDRARAEIVLIRQKYREHLMSQHRKGVISLDTMRRSFEVMDGIINCVQQLDKKLWDEASKKHEK